MAGGVGNGHRPGIGGTKQRELTQAESVNYSLDVEQQCFEREIRDVAFGLARAAHVIAHEHALLRKALVPVATFRDLPQLDVAPWSACQVDQRCSATERPEGYAYPISRPRVLNRGHGGWQTGFSIARSGRAPLGELIRGATLR